MCLRHLVLITVVYMVDLKQKPTFKCHCKGLSPLFGLQVIQVLNIIALYIFIVPVDEKALPSTTYCDLNKILLVM